MSRSAAAAPDVKFERGTAGLACLQAHVIQTRELASKSPAPDTLYGSFGIEI